MKKLFLILVLASGLAFAELQNLEGEKPVSFGEGKSQQTFKSLVVAELPEHHTRVIYSKQGICFPKAKGLVMIMPGTSARVDSEYGIEQSMGPVANELVKRGYAVLAMQPPIYHLSADAEGRKPFLERYAQTDANLEWYVKMVDFALARMPEGLELDYVGRSTGSGIGLEAFHRAMRGDKGFQLIRRFSNMFFMGVDGHTPEAITAWHQGEKHFYFDTEAGRAKADPPVVLAGPEIFGNMHWQTEALPTPREGERVPRVFMATGSRDEFAAPSSSLKPITEFYRNHPGVPGSLLFHNGGHDAGRGIKDVLRPMEGMKNILDVVLANEPAPSTFNVRYLPNEEAVMSAMPAEEQRACRAVLTAAGA